MLGGEVAGELLGEVLHHVVAFGFAVHQDIDAGLLLEGEDVADLAVDALLISGGVDAPCAQIGTGGAQFARLRERSDGRGGQQWQFEVGALGGCRSSYGWERRPSASVTAAALDLTAGSWVIGEFAREVRSARLVASSVTMASVP